MRHGNWNSKCIAIYVTGTNKNWALCTSIRESKGSSKFRLCGNEPKGEKKSLHLSTGKNECLFLHVKRSTILREVLR